MGLVFVFLCARYWFLSSPLPPLVRILFLYFTYTTLLLLTTFAALKLKLNVTKPVLAKIDIWFIFKIYFYIFKM